jgi:TonB family protein
MRRVVRIPGTPLRADAIAVGDESDRGLATVRETWTSPDLHVVLREKLFDPRLGESVTELINLHTGEQPAALFQAPPDYRIVDEPGDFAISFVARGPTSLPEVISKTPANYTDEARRRGIQGTVLLSATIDEAGKAQNIHVEQSVDPGLDQEAIKALHTWRFKPGTQGGHPVRVPVRVEITFRLDD